MTRDHDDDRQRSGAYGTRPQRPAPETATPPRPVKRGLGGGCRGAASRAPVTTGSAPMRCCRWPTAAACLTDSLPVRICASMLRRMLPFSTSTQCFAVGTNQLRAAARSLTLVAEQVGRVRDVALRLQGLLRARAGEVLDPVGRERLVRARDRDGEVGAAEEARASAWPLTWPGITNCAVERRVLLRRRSS